MPRLTFSITYNIVGVISFAVTRSYIYSDPRRRCVFVIGVLYSDIGGGGGVAKAGSDKALLLDLSP